MEPESRLRTRGQRRRRPDARRVGAFGLPGPPAAKPFSGHPDRPRPRLPRSRRGRQVRRRGPAWHQAPGDGVVIDSLAYIGFTSPNAQAWTTFGPEILGLHLAAPRPDGAVLLRNDDAAWRIAIHPGDTDDLAYLGWAVSGPEAVAAVTDRLSAAGIDVHQDDGTLAAQRMVSSLAWFTDPFGFRHELVHGLATEPGSFSAGRPGVSFVTGDEGLGHAVLIVPDWDAATQFFVDVLGFRVSDDIEAGIKVRFLHCNPRHHSLAFSAVPGMAGFHHLMLEVTDAEH